MRNDRKNTKYSAVEVDRNTIRYTYRASADVYDYLYKSAEKLGVPINAFLDYIIWEYKKQHEEGD